ncbi:MAG: hypothetical protein HDR80_08650 [Bacteroides sp.]|nr:hypothetical protein [Bacteroides sp.]
MCRQEPNPQPQPSQAPPQVLDRELQKANIELQLAQLRSNAEYYNSPAGQMQRQFETYQRLAKPLSESNFVPAAYKGNIGDCIVAVEMAARLGVLPLTVMQNLCVVKGNPTWKSKFLIGCVNTCGRYTTLDYHIGIDGKVGPVQYKTWEKGRDGKNHEVLKPFEHPELDNLTCVAFCTELSTGKELTSPAVSIRMAVQEGWYSKDGSKWPSMPELMLRYRAASMWVSTFAPELSMGFRTEEEQRDIVDVDYEEIREDQPRPVPRPRGTSASVEEAKEKLRARATSASKTNNPSDEMP